MKERPILFSAPMVRALLAGTKTVTRRLLKPRHDFHVEDGVPYFESYVYAEPESPRVPCPYGEAGDRLWVKETWQHADWTEDGYPHIRYAADDSTRLCEQVPNEWSERLSSRWSELSAPENFAIDGRAADRCWRPSIFMSRWASRITLDVISVRAERLLDITDEDAQREGVEKFFTRFTHIGRDQRITDDKYARDEEYRASFACLWDEINGDRALWNTSPWVWRVEFRPVPRRGEGES